MILPPQKTPEAKRHGNRKTEEQAAVLRGMGHIYEGVDLQQPMHCDACRKDYWNRQVYIEHMNRHAR